MPPKESKARLKKLAKEEQQRKKEEECRLLLLEKQELEKKEYSLRRAMHRDTLKLINATTLFIQRNIKSEKRKREWVRYSDCEPLPHANNPLELRTCMYKWLLEDKEAEEKYSNWLLQINERSILNQHLDRVICTREHLEKLQPNLTENYSCRANDILSILFELKDVLDNPRSYGVKSKKQENDLKNLKQTLRGLLSSCWDEYTLGILQNIERNMMCTDPVTAIYGYNSRIYSLNLYTLRPVPLPDTHICERNIELEALHGEIDTPPSLSLDEGVLRIVHTNYDHFSDNALSYNIKVKLPKVPTLLEAIVSEWEKRMSMRNNVIAEMKRARVEYDLKLIEIELKAAEEMRLAKMEADNKIDKQKKKPKKKKTGKLIEPPVVDENTVVDIENEYIAWEDEQYEATVTNMSPNSFHLNLDEINLRNYVVLGGCFFVEYLKKPEQNSIFNNNMSLRLDKVNKKLEHKIFHESIVPVHIPSDMDMKSEKATSLFHRKQIELSKLFKLKITLPKNILWFEEPIVCRWEKWENSEEFYSLPNYLQEHIINYEQNKIIASKKLFKNKLPKEPPGLLSIIEDFNLLEVPIENFHIHYLVMKHLMPRMPNTYLFKEDVEEEFKKIEMELKKQENLRREHEEEKKIKLMEKKIVEELDQKIMNEEITSSRLDILNVGHSNNTSMPSIIETNGAPVETSTDDVQSAISEKSLVFKKIVQGTPAKPLFPQEVVMQGIEIVNNYDCIPANVDENESYYLSDFIRHLNDYNASEYPRFSIHEEQVEEQSVERVELRSSISESVKSQSSKNFKPSSIQKSLISTKKSTVSEKSFTSIVTSQSFQSEDQDKQETNTKEVFLEQRYKGKWLTSNIYEQLFDPETNTLMFYTGCVGIFGLAVRKYIHFPFKNWTLTFKTNNIVVYMIECQSILLEINITPMGYDLVLLKPDKKHRTMDPPDNTFSFNELQNFLMSTGLNIFPERDGVCYNTIAEKHIAMEYHNYFCMSNFCITHNFYRTEWNKLATRRIAIIDADEVIENQPIKKLGNIMITPLDTYFVRPEEKCTPLSEFQVAYHHTPADQEYSCDLYQLLMNCAHEKSRNRMENLNIKLKWNVYQILKATRPLSYS